MQLIKKVVPITTIITVYSLGCNIVSKDSSKIDIFDEPEGIHSAFYNSKGEKISISTTKGRIILTDSTLQVLNHRKIHDGNANSSFFSLDDKFIITGGHDRFLNVSDARTLEMVNKYGFNFNSWTSVHGYTTLGGCGENGKLLIYNMYSGDTIVQILEDDGAFHLYYIQPDTSLVVSSGISGYEFDIQNKKISHTYKGHANWVYCIMPSNNKKRIVTASKDSTVKIFDRFSEKNLYTSSKLDGAVYVACFNYNDSIIAASTSVGSIYFMNSTLTDIYRKIKAFDTHVNTIHYSPDGSKILAGSEGGGAKIFSTATGELLYELDYSALE